MAVIVTIWQSLSIVERVALLGAQGAAAAGTYLLTVRIFH